MNMQVTLLPNEIREAIIATVKQNFSKYAVTVIEQPDLTNIKPITLQISLKEHPYFPDR